MCEKKIKSWRRPTFPPWRGSIIGKQGLDFRVRDGNGYFPLFYNHQQEGSGERDELVFRANNRDIIEIKDNMVKPHEQLVLIS